ncbi:hypothetical protein ABZS29_36235 [Kribbella sp. NPDC005582]|uniref:hypothetical protein n=1 Tax=Kribbella sp. NPDC005582 TaxID=3156893 RepID=UPI0033B8C0E5
MRRRSASGARDREPVATRAPPPHLEGRHDVICGLFGGCGIIDQTMISVKVFAARTRIALW